MAIANLGAPIEAHLAPAITDAILRPEVPA
jgi:hypothetical protein